jgi:hypothetical protein
VAPRAGKAGSGPGHANGGHGRGRGFAHDGLTAVAGHVNPDFDAYGAMVGATKLFPGSKAVWGGTQSANVREFHLLHGEFLEFTDLKGFDRSPSRGLSWSTPATPAGWASSRRSLKTRT